MDPRSSSSETCIKERINKRVYQAMTLDWYPCRDLRTGKAYFRRIPRCACRDCTVSLGRSVYGKIVGIVRATLTRKYLHVRFACPECERSTRPPIGTGARGMTPTPHVERTKRSLGPDSLRKPSYFELRCPKRDAKWMYSSVGVCGRGGCIPWVVWGRSYTNLLSSPLLSLPLGTHGL